MTQLEKKQSMPIKLLLVLSVSIFAIELMIMRIFNYFQAYSYFPPLLIDIMDSILLIALVFPVLHWLVVKPLLLEIKERKEAEENSRILNTELADEILERTKISEDLRQALRVKSEFLANMSHELRTPLNAINGFSEVLHNQTFGPLNEKQKEYIDYVLVGGKHLLSLINDILDLAKAEAGKVKLKLSVVSLKSLLEESYVMVKQIAFEKDVTVSLEIAQNIGDIKADERRLKEVVYNLLSNAIKFTPERGKVGIKARKTNSEVEIEVWDTGVGVARENLNKVFEVFTRIEEPYSRVTEGTGLGLAISKKLIELHGGRIWIESGGLNTGLSVKFILPLNNNISENR